MKKKKKLLKISVEVDCEKTEVCAAAATISRLHVPAGGGVHVLVCVPWTLLTRKRKSGTKVFFCEGW